MKTYCNLFFSLIFSFAICLSIDAFAQDETINPPIIDISVTSGIYSSAMTKVILDFEWSASVQYYVVSNDKIGIEYTMRNIIDAARFHDQHDLYKEGHKLSSQVLVTNEYRLLQYGLFSLWAKNGIGFLYFVYNESTDEPRFNTVYALPLHFGLSFDWRLVPIFSLGLGTSFTPSIALHKSRDEGMPFYISGEIVLMMIFHI